MCLIITSISAFITFLLLRKEIISKRMQILFIMYASAAIMWTVDCAYSKLMGDDFFDISPDDSVLGLIVVVCGMAGAKLLSFQKEKYLD